MNIRSSNLRSSTAAAALIVALSSTAAWAQAFVATNLATGETISSSADYTAGNTQKKSAITSATTGGSNVNTILTRTDAVDDTVTVATSETNNLISASATGNISTAGAILSFAPSTAGDTAAVGTLQAVEGNINAVSSGDTHSIVIDNTTGNIRTLTGTATQDNNDITASTTGNNATSSITAASGLDVVEAVSGRAVVLIDATLVAAGSTNDSSTTADLVVSSSQEIDATEAASSLTMDSTVGGATTSTLVESLDGATVVVSNSDQTSSTTGNRATSSISSLDTTASITGSTGVSNLQSLIGDIVDAVRVNASTISSEISVHAGVDSTAADAGTVVTDSSVTISQNTQSSSATGSASTQAVTLNASSIIGEGSSAGVLDSDAAASGVQLSASGDSVIANVQGLNQYVTVEAVTGGNTIASTMEPDNGSSSVTDTTLTIDSNTQSASATGVSTSNAMSLTSGAAMSAAGAVASVQNVDGSVDALTASNIIINLTGDTLSGGSMLTTNNTVSATAQGASATNRLETTTATNNLSLASNAGTVQNSVATTNDLGNVLAGQVLLNDQAMAGTASVTAMTMDDQVLAYIDDDAASSTVTTDGNRLLASATANTAGNTIALAFNELTGTIATGALTDGIVAATSNEQSLADNMTVTARNVGANGNPIYTAVDSDIDGSSVSTSGNIVAATARGNVTTANAVIVDATNISSGSQAAPSITSTTGALTAAGSFVAASTQVSGGDILASQLDTGGTTSNTILTGVGDDITGSSTVVSDTNVLSAVASANTASNSVQLGDANTATVNASGVVANYQGTTSAGSVSAELGIAGNDSVAAFASSNAATTPSSASDINYNSGTGGLVVTGTPVTVTFNTALTAQEALVLTNLGWTATAGSSSATIPVGSYNITGTLTAVVLTDPTAGTPGDETITVAGFTGNSVSGSRNGAGVLVLIDDGAGGAGAISNSTVSVSSNVAVGEVTGNTATNVASATATTVTGLDAAVASIVTSDTIVSPTGADLAVANLQSSAAPLTSDVAAVFGIVDALGNIDSITNSTQVVSDNLQQSFATANRATNSVNLTATNSTADTALDSLQGSAATVDTTSKMEIVANAGATTSTLEMDGNRNQSVANGNVVTNTTSLNATNATAATLADAGINGTTTAGTATNVLVSAQSVTASVTASAITDVYNQDATRPLGNVIGQSMASLSSNSTIAQATGNSGGNTLALGDADTANMEQTGLVRNLQTTAAVSITSTVDQDVSITLTNNGTVPVQSSSLSLDGNSSTASARGNTATNTLTADGANIDAGAGTDASLTSTSNLSAANVLNSGQANAAGVTATTTQSLVEVVLSDNNAATTNVVSNSTLSLSNNASSATATANTVVNAVSVGANAASVDASTALANVQGNTGSVLATGGSAVNVSVTAGVRAAAGINGSTVMLSGNSSVTNAVGNQAQNTLSASGANVTSGGTSSASVSSLTVTTASAGNMILNEQDNSAGITSANTANTVTIGSAVLDGTTIANGAAAVGSTLAVTGNVTEARASANLALNSSIAVGGASTTSVDSTGIVGNFQSNTIAGVVTSSASTTTAINLTGANLAGTGSAGALDTGSAMVLNNSTLALARGNVAENVVSANGANVSSGGSPTTLNSNGSPLSGVLNASFGVLNEQVQEASILATVTGSYRVTTLSDAGNALNAASATVAGNSFNASAFGNVATNSVVLASLNGSSNDAGAGVFNGQINRGAITSLATGATIGNFSTGAIVSAAVGVSNNTISATSVGNFATSTVTRANR